MCNHGIEHIYFHMLVFNVRFEAGRTHQVPYMFLHHNCFDVSAEVEEEEFHGMKIIGEEGPHQDCGIAIPGFIQ